MNPNVIFLDVDGVLNNYDSIGKGIQIIPEKVVMVDKLAQECDADIVLSSTWRRGWSRIEARNFFWRCGLTARNRFRDFTPVNNTPGSCRGDEIAQFLKETGSVYDNYVILDDDNDMLPEQMRHLVHVYGPAGLTDKDIERAKTILSRPAHK